MAVKGMAIVDSISASGTPGKFSIAASYVGLSGDFANGSVAITDASADITEAVLQGAVKDAVKAILIANHGYTFGLFDIVRVIGSTL